jgi:hypothetical protein
VRPVAADEGVNKLRATAQARAAVGHWHQPLDHDSIPLNERLRLAGSQHGGRLLPRLGTAGNRRRSVVRRCGIVSAARCRCLMRIASMPVRQFVRPRINFSPIRRTYLSASFSFSGDLCKRIWHVEVNEASMQVAVTEIADIKVITPVRHVGSRGFFSEVFKENCCKSMVSTFTLCRIITHCRRARG